VEEGQVWIKQDTRFDFRYTFPGDTLKRYIRFEPGKPPRGLFMDFIDGRKKDFRKVFDVVNLEPTVSVPPTSSVSRYAVIKPESQVGENVLVAQRAYVENSVLGKGTNAQENCFIVNSRLYGNNVTAHGAKLIDVQLEENVFVGFNSFVRGLPDTALAVGHGTIIMPHTIIDLKEPLCIPADQLVWGYISSPKELKQQSIPLKQLESITGPLKMGAMEFRGSGAQFVAAFQNRIQHILEANGAYFDGEKRRGHAQKGQNVAYNIVQAYPIGPQQGIFPTIDIQP
jgi:carbonic anhydrase/acetyltransferase-like protein (isoleucine patch superfamily)